MVRLFAQHVVVVFSLVACAATPGNSGTPRAAIPLAWLAGCWVTADGGTEERWTAVSGGYLFGSNITLKGGEVVFFEQLRIEPGADRPILQAYPRGVGPTSFVADETGDRAATFVNAGHDYPQRIRYERRGDSLTATVSLLDGSRPGVWQFGPCE